MKKQKIMCNDCGKREGIINFSYEPMYSLTHGYGAVHICRSCYIKRIEEELIKIKNTLKEQKMLYKNEKTKN